jgi:hypothetical protein
MAQIIYIKELSIFFQTTKNFIYWKICTINYLNIFGIWDIIEMGYIPRFDEIIKKLTVNSKIDKKNNDYAVNIILNSVSKSNGSLFDNMTSAYDI